MIKLLAALSLIGPLFSPANTDGLRVDVAPACTWAEDEQTEFAC
jgi:hypothetical protein